MRILEVGKFYPPVRGGMETVLATLCRGLAERGHELRVVVANDRWPGARSSVDGVDLRRLGSLGMLRSLPMTPALLPEIRSALREFRPDVVHIHLPHPAAGLAWLATGSRIPLVLSYHSDIVRQRWLGRLWQPGRRRLLDLAQRILVSSEALIHSSPALAARAAKCEAIPFGIDGSPFDHRGSEGDAGRRKDRGDYFLFVGRLVYYKGLDVLLEAMEGEPFRLLIAGEGPKRGEWEESATRRGMSERVEFLGEPADEELRDLLLGCTALVLPSTLPSESFGIVQLEAMAARRPVIAARASGGVESVQKDGETGLLVPPRDSRALREAMRRLWEDRAAASAMGEAARARFERRFTAVRMVEAVEAVLVDCVGEVGERA